MEYKAWLHQKAAQHQARYKDKWGWRPSWPDTERLWKSKDEAVPEEVKPFDRRRIIATTLFHCERDFECYTKMLADPLAPAANREHFLDWMWYANDRYARALKLEAKLKQPQPPLGQISLL